MIVACLALFLIFILFQLLYIFIPLYVIKKENRFKMVKEEKGISILIPAYNEETVILDCLQGILNLNYTNFEAIFINDGSKDHTFQLLYSYLDLIPEERSPAKQLSHQRVRGFYKSANCPNIYVLNKVNGGKADSLNAGIDYAKNEIIITLDADSVLNTKALAAMNAAFEDEKVLAAGGMVQISQGYNGVFTTPQPIFSVSGLIRYQLIQYLTDFYLHKITQAKLKSITVIAGAFGAFRRYALFEVNGYRSTVGEDLDITLRMQGLIKQKYKNHKLIFVPYAICYTECPSTLKSLFSQRIRWQKGFIDCMINFKKSFFRSLGIPVSIYLLVDSLILGTLNAYPTILIPIILLFTNNYSMALFFLSITFLLALYRSITAIIISRRHGHKYSKLDYLKICLFIPFEIVTFRLLGLIFVTAGTLLYLKNKEGWNKVDRVGVNHLKTKKVS